MEDDPPRFLHILPSWVLPLEDLLNNAETKLLEVTNLRIELKEI